MNLYFLWQHLSHEIQARQVSSDLGSGAAPILPLLLKSVDWSAIQALGNDTMTLNDNDSHDDGDAKSGKYDANKWEIEMEDSGSDTADEMEIIQSQPEMREVDQRSAIVGQVQRWVEYEVTHIIPVLYGLDNLTTDTPELENTAAINELIQVMKLLTTQLDKVHSTTQMLGTVPHIKTSSDTVHHASGSDGQKRHDRPVLLPTSPEHH